MNMFSWRNKKNSKVFWLKKSGLYGAVGAVLTDDCICDLVSGCTACLICPIIVL